MKSSLCKTILEIRENTLDSRQHRYEIEDLNCHKFTLIRQHVMILVLFLLLQVTRVTRASVVARARARKMTIRQERKTKRNEVSFLKLRRTSSGRGSFNILR